MWKYVALVNAQIGREKYVPLPSASFFTPHYFCSAVLHRCWGNKGWTSLIMIHDSWLWWIYSQLSNGHIGLTASCFKNLQKRANENLAQQIIFWNQNQVCPALELLFIFSVRMERSLFFSLVFLNEYSWRMAGSSGHAIVVCLNVNFHFNRFLQEIVMYL